MTERLPHYISVFATVLVGFRVASTAPATHQFEQAMRALDITGQVLSPLSLLYDSAVTLIAMAVVYFVTTAILASLRPRGRRGITN